MSAKDQGTNQNERAPLKYFVDFDEPTGSWCIFRTVNFAYESYSSEEEAKERAKTLNAQYSESLRDQL